MRRERWLLRLGESLVRAASRRLPRRVRDERYREWTAELPVILHDPDGGRWPLRAGRMLGYALDTIRGTAVMPRSSRSPAARRLAGLWTAGVVALVIYFDVTANDGFGMWVTTLAVASTTLVRYDIQWRRRTRGPVPAPGWWLSVSVLITAAGYALLRAAQDSHWQGGMLRAVTLASHCTAWVGVGFLVISAAVAVWLRVERRAARRDPGQPTR